MGNAKKNWLLVLFKWVENTSQVSKDLRENYIKDIDDGYIFETDAHYIQTLFELHCDLLFLLEKMKI